MFAHSNKPLDDRMAKAMRKFDLTVRDLAAWLDRPYGTVYDWTFGTVPRGDDHAYVTERLQLLMRLSKRTFLEVYPTAATRQDAIRKVYASARRAYPIQRGSPR